MKQDRRLNVWVLLSSMLGILGGMILISSGAFVAAFGFLKPERIAKIKEIVFFLSQDWVTKLQLNLLNNQILKTEFLYLFSGIIFAVVGLIVLIFAIMGLVYAKKRKVVRRKFALLLFNLIPLLIVGGVVAYLVIEEDMFKQNTDIINNIKYCCYGVAGLFGTISLFNILGILFGRSEKFMSNDNGKYAFDNSKSHNVRPNQGNTGAGRQVAQNSGQAHNTAQPQNQYYQSNQGQSRPVQRAQQPQQRPVSQTGYGQPVQRPMQGQPAQRPAQRPAQPRTATANPQAARPSMAQQSRPQTARPATGAQGATQPTRTAVKRCPRCGNVLAQGEKQCSKCGYIMWM